MSAPDRTRGHRTTTMTDTTPTDAPQSPARSSPSGGDYLAALKQYEPSRRIRIFEAIAPDEAAPRPGEVASSIAARLGDAPVISAACERLGHRPRVALSLFSLSRSDRLTASELAPALRALGAEPASALVPLLELGLLVAHDHAGRPLPDLGSVAAEASASLALILHPSLREATPNTLPVAAAPPPSGSAGLVREADGLEPILRLAALWQRVRAAPIRQTQQGTLFKRDRERLAEDPALVGPIADALEPLPDMAGLWLELARVIGLIEAEPGSDRIVATDAEFWSEHAVHLPHMLGLAWLGLRAWDEQAGRPDDESSGELPSPLLRPVALLWLAARGETEWTALDDLAANLERLSPGWVHRPDPGPDPSDPPRRSTRGRAKPPRSGAATSRLAATLLGPAYQLGLVRVAEESPGRRRLVQLTPLGRYVLGVGRPPAPRETFETFLVVQPNFEVLAYRQGLQPWLVGLLSRFLDWEQLGAAAELRLSAESVYRGLEGGLTPEQMAARLERHSGRPLPPAVADALTTWSGRRERLAFHTSATLIEFLRPEDLEAALADWPDGDGKPVPSRVSGRILLVPEGAAIPYHRFRVAGSRDYRQPSEPCVEVEPDGVTLGLDLGRTDLLIDAEIGRLADPVAARSRSIRAGESPRRWYRVSRGSLTRALGEGMTPQQLERWFEGRTGAPPPPAVRLLLHAMESPTGPAFRIDRPVVLHAPSPELLDGLFQHPDGRGLLGERLGPRSVVVPAGSVDALRRVLLAIGLTLGSEDDDAT